jgi:hypothetical protein
MVQRQKAIAPPPPGLHQGFLSILSRIQLHAEIFFRGVRCPHKKEDAIAETVGLAFKWYVRLIQRGKDPRQFPSTLATFAAKAVKSGRRVCGQERAKDALSSRAQQRHSFTVSPLPQGSSLAANVFDLALRDSTQSPPDEQVMFKLDMATWLVTLGERNRNLVVDMMLGHRTKELAQIHRITEGRVSQLRRELYLAWLLFHGELPPHPAYPRVGNA